MDMAANVSEEALQELTGEDGIFGDGAGLRPAMMDEDAAATFHEELGKQTGVPVKQKKKLKEKKGQGPVARDRADR